jgi:hypothetical protein
MARRGPGRVRRHRRRAQLTGAAGFGLAASLPWVLWHHLLHEIASEYRFDLNYLISELSPWILIAAGILFLVPVAWSAGRDPDSRFYPRAWRAYLGWGLTLYILGVALASQVAQLAHLNHV